MVVPIPGPGTSHGMELFQGGLLLPEQPRALKPWAKVFRRESPGTTAQTAEPTEQSSAESERRLKNLLLDSL